MTEAIPEAGRVVLGKVDCDQEGALASRFHVSKYPTLKIIRNGVPVKREYRGQRSADAFVEFVKKQLEDPIIEFHSLKDLEQLDARRRIVVGYFDRRDQPEYSIFRRVATNLKEDCQFHVGFGDIVAQMHPPGQPIVAFRPDIELSRENDETYTGSLTSLDELSVWVQQKCVPFVREITFENAEELTEEGLPFLILFHSGKDTETVKDYKTIVETQLISEKRKHMLHIPINFYFNFFFFHWYHTENINFLTADGERFAHPLHHLGKSMSDLPLIAIDSFRHMYLFPNFKDMYVSGKLKTFLEDLYSGKLHR